MKFLPGQETKNYLEDIVYEKKQVHKHCVDLTVKKVYQVTGESSMDFGGSEFEPAEKKILKPKKKNDQDKYGWWNLKPGYYMFKYNELLTLAPGQKAIVQIHPNLLKSGGFHPTIIKENSGELNIPVIVNKKTNIKENARVSEVRIIEN
ncbi:MAG: dCTP deaminase [Elusimicrobiota bacterium]